MRQPGRRWMPLWVVVLLAMTACTAEVAGSPHPGHVIGVTQRAIHGGSYDITPLVFLDPAPVYRTGSYSYEPEEGTRLVAVQFKVTNKGGSDDLISPIGTVRFHGSDGRTYDDSLVDTSAGPMFDQLSLAPNQSTVGYFTGEVPVAVTVEAVDFQAGYDHESDPLAWEVVGAPETTAPKPPARKDGGVDVHPLGQAVPLTGERDGIDNSLSVAATEVIDPAEGTVDVQPGAGRRLVGVEFAVRNTGDEPYNDVGSDSDLRIFALYNQADESVRSHVYGTSEKSGIVLQPNTDDTWTVLFEVPADFVVDRISFSPMFGEKTTTIWAAA